MSRWLISAPAWGQRCVDVFCATALPAIERAMVRYEQTTGDAYLIVHTDSPDRVRGAASQIRIETRPPPAGLRAFDCLSQSHREVLSMGLRGDRVMLLTADLILSEEGLLSCERILSQGDKWLVACAGIRALESGMIPASNGRELLDWAWEHRHPMTQACTWPGGRSSDLSRVYFSDGPNVVARLCLPHPLAVLIDGRPLPFSPTIDVNLIKNFHDGEIYLVTSPDDLGLVELSPPDKDFQVGHWGIHERLSMGKIVIADPQQRTLMSSKIVLRGSYADCEDDAYVNTILESS